VVCSLNFSFLLALPVLCALIVILVPTVCAQSELLDEVQDYLLQTVTVNAENGGALRSRCERLRDATLNALATARTKHSQAATTAHATMAEVNQCAVPKMYIKWL